jgi:hypothetical protein
MVKESEDCMSNWKFFMGLVEEYKPYFKRPKIKILEERNDYLSRYPDAWAYYENNNRTAYILKEYDNLIVRIHELGHWANTCIYFSLEIFWEFIWWGLGFRSLVKNKGDNK